MDSVNSLFTGKDKYVAGLLIMLASVVNFITHFNKAQYHPMTTYAVLVAIVIMGSVIARW